MCHTAVGQRSFGFKLQLQFGIENLLLKSTLAEKKQEKTKLLLFSSNEIFLIERAVAMVKLKIMLQALGETCHSGFKTSNLEIVLIKVVSEESFPPFSRPHVVDLVHGAAPTHGEFSLLLAQHLVPEVKGSGS